MLKYSRTLLYFMFLISICLYSQPPEEIQVTPVAPEAASMGRYGGLDIMSATGQMSYSIPIYNIQVNGKSWPISLDYSYGGLILEGKPSLSGLGWMLNAYGSITKEIRGLPDGHPDGYYGSENRKAEIDAVLADYADNELFDQTHYSKFRNFRDGIWDSEVDKYTVNLRGEPFSFKLKKVPGQNSPEVYYLSKARNYKVEVNMDNTQYFTVSSFTVIDLQGIKYHFYADDREYVYSDPDVQYPEDKTTSWLLSEIDYGNGQSIAFEYDEVGYFSHDFWAEGVSKITNVGGDFPSAGDIEVATGYWDGIRSSEMRRQVLTGIYFPKGSITLNHTTTGNVSLFNNLTLKDDGETTIDQYTFTYQGNRDNLTEITKNGEFHYGFEYFGIAPNDSGFTIPSFIDSNEVSSDLYAQDFWRFYNGRVGNTSAINLVDPNYTANRTPHLNSTQAGALKTINYKTGGSTEVFYEQNQVKEEYTGTIGGGSIPALNREILVELNPNMADPIEERELEIVVDHTFDTPTLATISHLIDGRLSDNYFKMSITKIGGNCNLPFQCYDVNNLPSGVTLGYADMADYLRTHMTAGSGLNPCEYYPYPIMCPAFESSPTGPHDFPETYYYEADDTGGYIYIHPGTYRFKITTYQLNSSVSGFRLGEIYGRIWIRYYEADDGDGNLPEYINKDVGGIRVAKIIDCSKDGSQALVRKYDYNDDQGFSTARLNQTPLYSTIHTWRLLGGIYPSGGLEVDFEHHDLHAYTALNTSHGVPVYYRQIKSHTPLNPNGSTSDSGHVLTEYYLPVEDIGYSYPLIPKGSDLTKSQLKYSHVFGSKTIDPTPEVISSTTKNYNIARYDLEHDTTNDVSTDHPVSFKIYKKQLLRLNFDQNDYDQVTPSLNTEEDKALKALHDIVIYKEVDSKRVIDNERTLQDGVSQLVSYEYDYQDKYLLQKTTTEDSHGDVIETLYDYPYELSESQYNLMTANNQLTPPVSQQTFRNNELISSQKTNFILVDDIFMPSEILTSKGDKPLESRMIYNYDSKGNIIEQKRSETGSTPTAYIWGYNYNYPVAKIENATYQQAISHLGMSSTQLQSLSDSALRNAIGNIRQNLPDARVTTFTYIPLIGISSITDSRGQIIYYEYDDQNRLEYVRDLDNNLLNETEYYYRNQN